MKKITFLLFITILWGCSSRNKNQIPKKYRKLKNLTVFSSNSKPTNTISLQKVAAYGSSKKVIIGRMGGIAVDNSGHVYIPDEQQKTIDVFKPDGQFLTHIGHKGNGPGEFNYLMNVQTTQNELIADDAPQQRAVVFSLPSFKYKYTIPIANNRNKFKALKGTYPNAYYAKSKNSFLVTFGKNAHSENHAWDRFTGRNLYYSMNKKGRITSQKLLEMKSQEEVLVPYSGSVTNRRGVTRKIPVMGYHPGFYGKSLKALSNNDHFYWAWSTDFLIKVYNSDGTYQRAIYYPYKNIPLTQKSANIAKTPKFVMKGWKKMKLPKTWPALHSMIIDSQNRIWVSTIVKNFKDYRWWVLNNRGKLLAHFNWPRDRQIEVIKNGDIYAKEKNKKGLTRIVKYKYELKSL